MDKSASRSTYKSIEVDCGSYEINMFSEMSWHAVIVTSEVVIARISIGIGMVFCSKKGFNLLHSRVELDPAKTLGKLNSVVIDPVLCKPRLDRANSFA
jgi:hypothetical protein